MQTEDIDLQNLGLFDDGEEAVDLGALPAERSSLPNEIPQPGTLVLRIPGNLTADPAIFGQVTDTEGYKRLRIKFTEDMSLLIQPSGTPLSYNVFDFRRTDREGNVRGEMLSFLRALGTSTATSKAEMVKSVLAARGKDFKADLAYEATCNPKRAAWRNGKKDVEPGCGQKYDMKARTYPRQDGTQVVILQVPRDPSGKWLSQFACTGCGADVRAFVRLSNYRAK